MRTSINQCLFSMLTRIELVLWKGNMSRNEENESKGKFNSQVACFKFCLSYGLIVSDFSLPQFTYRESRRPSPLLSLKQAAMK